MITNNKIILLRKDLKYFVLCEIIEEYKFQVLGTPCHYGKI